MLLSPGNPKSGHISDDLHHYPFILESSLEQEDFCTITVGCNDGISEIVFIMPEIVVCLHSVNGPYLQPHAGMLMKASPEKQEH